jgi:hypothetical protein
MRVWTTCGLVAVAALAAGCDRNGPVTVTGAVTLDGRPVGSGSPGTIRFQPADPSAGRAAEGFVRDGRYEVTVPPGRYDVAVSWERWPDKSETRGKKPPPGYDEIPPEQMIPARYAKAGQLTADVSHDTTQLDFPLAAK